MKLVADGLLEGSPDAPVLLGGRHRTTGKMIFPMPEGAAAADYVKTPLKSEGALWSYTVQRFPPKSPFIGEKDPENFKPYALGYVELEGQGIIETRSETDDFEALKGGLPMKLILSAFAEDETGAPIHTYAFTPA